MPAIYNKHMGEQSSFPVLVCCKHARFPVWITSFRPIQKPSQSQHYSSRVDLIKRNLLALKRHDPFFLLFAGLPRRVQILGIFGWWRPLP